MQGVSLVTTIYLSFADLGVHDIGSNVGVSDMLSKATAQFLFDLLEVKGFHRGTRSSINARLITDDFGAERLREATNRLSKIALEELDNRRGEVKFLSAVLNILRREIVRGHPLGKVTNNLGRRSDFNDIATEVVGLNILLLDD